MKKYLHIILASSVLGVAILIAFWMFSRPVKASVEKKARIDMPVSVEPVKAGTYTASVQAFGKAVPYWKTDIVSAVSGRLVELAPVFDAGRIVPKGDLLAKVEDVEYRSELAARERELADAKLAYVQEQHRVKQAEKDWKRMGQARQPASPLVLRKPQLEAALAQVKAAEGAVAKARNDFQNTLIVAPYDAAVIERKVALGTYVTAGTVVGSVYGADRVEVRFPLTEQQCSLLNLDAMGEASRYGAKVPMTSVTNSRDKWVGTLMGLELQLSDTTRQRTAIVMVENPLDGSQPLLPGTFVRAEVPGAEVKETFAVPESSLTQAGDIWYTDNGNSLRRIKPEVRFRRNGKVFIQAPENLKAMNVVVRPLNSYLEGTSVSPILSELSHE
ncbi:efflux RND transporter periplasmic adaptor subunit [Pseudodesulfovibrio karagichevae]|uniref:Efflux RND transporter periplasmic adaptor subunit n=1 Tax=Pseudodesulfovibrio karagichevae TaxID=3239305 RepID=A0ABV4K1C5_9BACT